MNYIKELIEALPGVEFVHISTNRAWAEDKKTGLAPQSFKVYVLGGKKKEIAQIIWNHKTCAIPIENEPEDGATDAEWWIWAATGVGYSPVEAYNDWVKDWEDKV